MVVTSFVRYRRFLAGLLALIPILFPNASFALDELDGPGYVVSLSPNSATTSEIINLVGTRTTGCLSLSLNSIEYDLDDSLIHVSIFYEPLDFGVCGEPLKFVFPVGKISEPGTYVVNVYEEIREPGKVYFELDELLGSLDLIVSEASTLARAETPTAASIQSGIGVIRGWASATASTQLNRLV